MANYPGTNAAEQARELHLRLFGDEATGTALSPEEAEARADLANAPRLADKVVQDAQHRPQTPPRRRAHPSTMPRLPRMEIPTDSSCQWGI